MYTVFNFLGSIFGYILWAIYYVVPNFGVAIIIFTLIFKIVLFPASLKQQKSMAANSRLQAKQRELKEKYGNDKARYNEEVQKLYEKEGTSPFSGCLNSLFPMFVMLGIYYSVSRPISNMLHIASDKVTSVLETINHIPGISINSSGIYSQIDLIRLFNSPKAFSLLMSNTDISSTLSAADVEKIKGLSSGFNFLGLDLLSTPKNTMFTSWVIIIPILCLVTSVGSQIYMMRTNGSMNNQQGCMKYTLLALPLLTAWIAYTVPAAVGFYWICSTVLGFVQAVIMNKMFSAQQITAKQQAQHIALLELQESQVKYEYVPSQTAQNNINQKNKSKKKKK